MHDAMNEAAEQDAREFRRRFDAAGGKLVPPRTLEEAMEMTEHELVGHYLQAGVDGREADEARIWSYVTEIAARR